VIDLEREVRELLEQRAENAAERVGGNVPAGIWTRVRRRQARTVALSGLVAALVAAGALIGVRSLVLVEGRRLGTAPSPTSTLPVPPTAEVDILAASGKVEGQPWTLVVGTGEESGKDFWCVDIKFGMNGVGTCGADLLDGRDLSVVVLQGPELPAVLVGGAVSEEVARVVFDRDTGADVEGAIYPLPEGQSGPFDAFVIPIPKDRPVGGAVLAFDSKGDVLEQHGVYAESVLTQGHFRGLPWMLLHNRQHECLEALRGGIRYSVCNTRVPDRSFMEWTTIGMPAARENLLFGFVRADTVRLVAEEPGGGQAEARVFPLPWDAKAKAFFVEIDGHRGKLVAIDAIGEEIRAEPFRLVPLSEG